MVGYFGFWHKSDDGNIHVIRYVDEPTSQERRRWPTRWRRNLILHVFVLVLLMVLLVLYIFLQKCDLQVYKFICRPKRRPQIIVF